MTGSRVSSHFCPAALLLAVGCLLVFVPGAGAAAFSNSAPIIINDSGSPPTAASPYPSPVVVSGVAVAITNVSVTLHGFTHAFPDDVDLLVVGPGGQRTLLMSDACGGNPGFSGLELTFADAAAGQLADAGPCVAGTYKPSNYPETIVSCNQNDLFPSPAPAGTPSSTLSVFNGLSGAGVNGTWSLFLVDDCVSDSGVVMSGWTLTLTTTPTAAGIRSFTAVRGRNVISLRWRTAQETGLLGFDVYRLADGVETRVNNRLVSAKDSGAGRGTSYVLRDRAIQREARYRYRLEAVRLDGSRSWLGSVYSAGG